MPGPSLLVDALAVVMIFTAACGAGRLLASVRRSPAHGDIALSHILMGLAMAGMLVPSFAPVPTDVWERVFLGLALWFVGKGVLAMRDGFRGRRGEVSHYLTHLVMALTMGYMYGVAASGTPAPAHGVMAMSGPVNGNADFVFLPLLLLVAMVAAGCWELDIAAQRFWRARAATSAGQPGISRLGAASHIAMCITTCYMLVVLL